MHLKNQNEISEEELDYKLSTLNALKDQQHQLFLLVVQRFIEVINERLKKPDVEVKMEDGTAADPTMNQFWLKWISERLEDVLLTVNNAIILNFSHG